jgi:hypothetical protein
MPIGVLSALLALIAVFQPVPFGLALRGWIIAVAGLVAGELVRATLSPYPRLKIERVHFGRPRRPAKERPAGLEEVERAVDFAVWNAVDLRRRLEPLVRDIATYRLRVRRGIDLERDPDAARQTLGDAAWRLLEPDDPGRADRRGPGVTASDLREAVERLERV